MNRRILVVGFLLTILLGWSALADVVYLKGGGTKEGKIIRRNEDEVVLEVRSGGLTASIRVPADRIEKIERKLSPQEEFSITIQNLSPDDARGFYQTGLWCETKGLKEEARFCFEKALEIEPEMGEAAEKLGLVRVQNRWWKVEDVIAESDNLCKAHKHKDALNLLSFLSKLSPEKMHTVLRKEILMRLARCYEALSKWGDAIRTYDSVLKCTRLKRDVALARTKQRILAEHPDGKFDCPFDPTLFKDANAQKAANLLGPQPLTRADVMNFAVRVRAREILAEAEKLVAAADDEAKFKPDKAEKLYLQAQEVADDADLLVPGISAGLRLKVALAREAIVAAEYARALKALQTDKGYNKRDAYPGLLEEAKAYLKKTEELCKLPERRVEILRPVASQAVKQVDKALADLEAANKVRQQARDSLQQLLDEREMEKLEAEAAEAYAKALATDPNRQQYAYRKWRDTDGIYRFKDKGKKWRRYSDLCMSYCRKAIEANKKRLDLMRKYYHKFRGYIPGVKAAMVRAYQFQVRIAAHYNKKGR